MAQWVPKVHERPFPEVIDQRGEDDRNRQEQDVVRRTDPRHGMGHQVAKEIEQRQVYQIQGIGDEAEVAQWATERTPFPPS